MIHFWPFLHSPILLSIPSCLRRRTECDAVHPHRPSNASKCDCAFQQTDVQSTALLFDTLGQGIAVANITRDTCSVVSSSCRWIYSACISSYTSDSKRLDAEKWYCRRDPCLQRDHALLNGIEKVVDFVLSLLQFFDHQCWHRLRRRMHTRWIGQASDLVLNDAISDLKALVQKMEYFHSIGQFALTIDNWIDEFLTGSYLGHVPKSLMQG